MTRKNNKDIIMEIINSVELPINTTDLAELAGIDRRNIGRYLKELERDKKINRITKQEGKLRFVLINKFKDTTRKKEATPIKKEKKEILPSKKPIIPKNPIISKSKPNLEHYYELCERHITQYSDSKCYKKDGTLNASGRLRARSIKERNILLKHYLK